MQERLSAWKGRKVKMWLRYGWNDYYILSKYPDSVAWYAEVSPTNDRGATAIALMS
jgi:hypothetical protein